ncbi:MAG TPA: hypothetical protein VF762_14335 [Blastocatellia bacterium]|jgi:hypothetical protein
MKHKLGDRVTIEVNRRRGASQPGSSALEPHYGAIRRIEDDERSRPGRLDIAVIDVATKFVPRLYASNHRYWLYYEQIHSFVQSNDVAYCPFDLLGDVGFREYFQANCIAGGSLSGDAAVAKVDSGVYRRAFDRWPLPVDNPYGVSLFLNAAEEPLDRERQITNPLEIEEQAADFEEMYPPGNTSNQNFWHKLHAAYWKNYARVSKPTIKRNSTYRIECSGINFEPFDPFDTTNFKVTRGAFDSEEIPAPKVDLAKTKKRRNTLRLGLFPMWWRFELTYYEWAHALFFDVDNPGAWYRKTVTQAGEIYARTSPLAEWTSVENEEFNAYTFNRNTDELAGSAVNVTITGLPPLGALPSGYWLDNMSDEQILLFRDVGKMLFEFGGSDLAFEFTFSNGSDGWPNDPVLNPLEGAGSTLHDAVYRSDCTAEIAVADTPIGALVGAVEYNNERWNVYRKTAAIRGASIYSGPLDGLFAGQGYDAVGDPAHKNIGMYPSSAAKDFSDFDPGNTQPHITL